MAILKTDRNITAISGRFGGMYFKTTGGIIQAQAMPRKVTWQSSPKQDAQKEGWSMGFSIWQIIGILGFFILWDYLAQKGTYVDRKGNVVKLPARGWFMHFWGMRISGLKNQYIIPPEDQTKLPAYVGKVRYFQVVNQNYYPAGIYDEFPYYMTNLEHITWSGEPDIKKFYLWSDGEAWYVTPHLGEFPEHHYWTLRSESPVGLYDPSDPSDGPLSITL